MQLLDELKNEHELIDRTLGSFRGWLEMAMTGNAPIADGLRVVGFLSTYAGSYHHEREERLLFPALVEKASLPADRGPIAVLLSDHHHLEAALSQIRELLETGDGSLGSLRRIEPLVIDYTRRLWQHIDAENSVLLPESEMKLRSQGIREIPSRPPSPDENHAAEIAVELIARYPAIEDAELVRGEGCAMCAAYLDSCAGIEREWWNEWEWEELAGRLGGD